MIGVIKRQHYGRKILEDRPRKRQKSAHTPARRGRVGVTGYYPQKLFYNELPRMMQCHRHPVTSISFDGVKNRKQHLVSVTLHDGSITISNPGVSQQAFHNTSIQKTMMFCRLGMAMKTAFLTVHGTMMGCA